MKKCRKKKNQFQSKKCLETPLKVTRGWYLVCLTLLSISPFFLLYPYRSPNFISPACILSTTTLQFMGCHSYFVYSLIFFMIQPPLSIFLILKSLKYHQTFCFLIHNTRFLCICYTQPFSFPFLCVCSLVFSLHSILWGTKFLRRVLGMAGYKLIIRFSLKGMTGWLLSLWTTL